MMPGVTCLPAASMTIAPEGADSPVPTLVILPFSTSRSAFCSVPCGPTVQMVAFFTRTAAAGFFIWHLADTETQSTAAPSIRYLRAVFTFHLHEFRYDCHLRPAVWHRRVHRLGLRDPRQEPV